MENNANKDNKSDPGADNDSLEEGTPNENNSIKTNDNALCLIFNLLMSLKPEFITPTCRENLNTMQTLLNNVLKRSIGHNERIRSTKFTPIQTCVFVQVLHIGETTLAKSDWPSLNFKHQVPVLVSRKGKSPLVMPPSNLPMPGMLKDYNLDAYVAAGAPHGANNNQVERMNEPAKVAS